MTPSPDVVPFSEFFKVKSQLQAGYKQNQYLKQGALPIIDQGINLIGGYTNELDREIRVDKPVVVFGDHTRCVKYVRFNFALGADGVKVLEVMDDVDSKFAFYHLLAIPLRNRGYARHMGELRKAGFWKPTLDVQRAIVETIDDHLSRLDKALAEVTSALQKFETLERAAMAVHFSPSPDGELQRVVTIAEVTGKAKSLDPKTLGKESFKYVDIGSISPDSETPNVSAWTPISAAPSRARQHIHMGDVVFSTVRPYQKKIAIVDQDLDGHIASTGFCVLRPTPGVLDTRYLFHYLKSDALMDQVLPLQRGASYPAVGDSDVKNSTIPLPDLAAQVAIAEELDQVVGTVKMMKSQLQDISRTANAMRRSVLHSAFSGKLLEEK